MRHALGRHERRRQPSVISYVIALMAAVAALIASAVFAGQSGQAAAGPVSLAARSSGVTYASYSLDKAALLRAASAAHAAVARAALAAHAYTVRGGDSISSVAARECGAARDWTGIYAASRLRHLTARDANALRIGQHLWLSCSWDRNQLGFARTAAPAPAVTAARRITAHGDRWDGQHGRCGDGDGDGYDAPCSAIFGQRATAVPAASEGDGGSAGTVRRTYHGSYHAVSNTYRAASSGTYSYAGLEALWVSAGGPSWAAPHAASIAECESGGRTSAYNPSGATGLWQILGSVVPGSLYNAYTNALNAVAKFRASGDTFAQWVCR